jgi:hypothetical protein
MDQPDRELQLFGLRLDRVVSDDTQRPSWAATDAERPPVLTAEDEDASLTLLERLDRRQNQVLRELDRLNERIECLVVQCQDQRQSPQAA